MGALLRSWQAEATAVSNRSPAALATAAVRALISEASLSPKPGLVDQRGGGAHQDMDWWLLCRSARALQPGLLAMAQAAQELDDLASLRRAIGRHGRDAEAAMLAVTGGINTHRGAIWALGLLLTAAAHWPEAGVAELTQRAAQLARLPDSGLEQQPAHPGARACQQYGVGGARAQAMAGFPQVMQAGLPTLRHTRQAGAGEACAQLDALLAIMAQLDDTCLLARGGVAGLQLAQQGAAAVLQAGGSASATGRVLLQQLDRQLLARRLSPGGAADLLAATLLLDSLPTAS
ncbi:triphosphoribosyl-dephospho-CoA synthase [Neisseriaceae bacterium TC5R-5]|nr:triphosphoribosyl-dephospho-CoA synthase [Neisseriaceae bacterium TC5R-5]